jgi:caffeoyl-CoA O-methyltransferase
MQIIAPVVGDYLQRHCTGADGLLGELIVATREGVGTAAGMQTSADEGAFLTMLTRMTDARLAVEVGVFTGYSSICIAGASPPADACSPATPVTSEPPSPGSTGSVPGWPSASTSGSARRSRRCRRFPPSRASISPSSTRTSPVTPPTTKKSLDGCAAAASSSWTTCFSAAGVLDPAYQEEHYKVIRRLNDQITADERMDSVMLLLRDGITIARKR